MNRTRMTARVAALALVPVGVVAGLAPRADAAATLNYSNPAPITIVDNANANPYPSSVLVNQGGVITKVTVTLTGLSHTSPDDIGVVLVAPNNDALLLMDGVGDAATAVTNADLTFDDAAAAALPASGAVTTGTYKPTSYYTNDVFPAPGPVSSYGTPGPVTGGTATLASTFNGDPATGTWKLFVRDFAAGGAGSITGGWSLSISTDANTLTVASAGNGSVTGTGIACPGDCSETYTAGTSVPLTATASAGSHFTGWSGACTGTGACTVVMATDKAVAATFALDPSLTVTTTGNGSVTGTGIACPGDCSESYAVGTNVPLTATAAAGSHFTGWSGACTGTGTCTVAMTADKTVGAAFAADPTATLTVTSTGSGSVTGTGIACPGDCSQSYAVDTSVALTATASVGSHFTGWAGACTGTGACTVAMAADKTVGAAFAPDPSTTITKGPKSKTTSTKAAFSFTSDVSGATFQCSLDGAAFTPCVSGVAVKHLAKGKHTFSVRAVDAGGVSDPTPASSTWKVKKKKHHH